MLINTKTLLTQCGNCNFLSTTQSLKININNSWLTNIVVVGVLQFLSYQDILHSILNNLTLRNLSTA